MEPDSDIRSSSSASERLSTCGASFMDIIDAYGCLPDSEDEDWSVTELKESYDGNASLVKPCKHTNNAKSADSMKRQATQQAREQQLAETRRRIIHNELGFFNLGDLGPDPYSLAHTLPPSSTGSQASINPETIYEPIAAAAGSSQIGRPLRNINQPTSSSLSRPVAASTGSHQAVQYTGGGTQAFGSAIPRHVTSTTRGRCHQSELPHAQGRAQHVRESMKHPRKTILIDQSSIIVALILALLPPSLTPLNPWRTTDAGVQPLAAHASQLCRPRYQRTRSQPTTNCRRMPAAQPQPRPNHPHVPRRPTSAGSRSSGAPKTP